LVSVLSLCLELMTNHVHRLMEREADPLSRMRYVDKFPFA